MKRLIFVEGIPGSGKSTLMNWRDNYEMDRSNSYHAKSSPCVSG